MEAVFISKSKPFLDAVAEQMELYVLKMTGQHFTYIVNTALVPRPRCDDWKARRDGWAKVIRKMLDC